MPLALPALWVLGCFSLLLWLWVLCTACHRTRVPRHRARPQGSVMPVQVSVLRQTHLRSLSKSDTRLHELHRCPHGSTARRPASMDLLHPHWLEVPRGSTRPQAAPSIFPPQQLPGAPPVTPSPFIGPEATYSNVGLAAIPRASLAASPMVWAGTRLTIGCARPGPGARPLVAEYACIQQLKGTGQGPQELQQGTADGIPAAQVDILYSRVCKSKSRDPGLLKDQPDLKGGGSVLAPRNDLTCETLPFRNLGMDSRPLENVYESIQEMGASGQESPFLSSC